jgi:hypothetical protein
MSANGLYEPKCGEILVDATETWNWVFGRDHDPAKPPFSGRGYPEILFTKLLPPFIPYFSQFDRVVVLDDDIEVTSPDFLPFLDGFPLADDADIAAVPDTAVAKSRGYTFFMRHEAHRCLWTPGVTYFCMGVVLHRTTWTPGYLSRVRTCLVECEKRELHLPEEMSANLYLRIQDLPERVSMIPDYPEVRRIGASKEELADALSVHWAGPRKKIEAARWAARYPEVKP